MLWVLLSSWAVIILSVSAEDLMPQYRSQDGGTLMGKMVAMVSNMPPISMLNPVGPLVMMPMPSGNTPTNTFGSKAISPPEAFTSPVTANHVREGPYGDTIFNAPSGPQSREVIQGAWRITPPKNSYDNSERIIIRRDDTYPAEDILAPAGFNPLEVFLPAHLRPSVDSIERNQRSSEEVPSLDASQVPHLLSWPNTGLDSFPAIEQDVLHQQPQPSQIRQTTAWPMGDATEETQGALPTKNYIILQNIGSQNNGPDSDTNLSNEVNAVSKLKNTFALAPTEKTISADQLLIQNNSLPVIVVKSNTTENTHQGTVKNNTPIAHFKKTTRYPEATEYTQPWLHVAVQHDLMRMNLPYDKDALHGPEAQELLQTIDDNTFHSHSSLEKVPHEEMETSNTDTHMAIVEVPKVDHNGPVHIRNVHVIAPAPKNVPPVPLFRPAEKKPLEQPPYVVRSADPRATTTGREDEAMLVVPYPAERLDPRDRSSRVFPAMLPLKRANPRQEMNPIEVFMKPIRDIFQLGSPARNVPQFRQQPVRQQHPFPPLLQAPPARETPVPEFILNNLPGFGPPKGEDVVSRQTENQTTLPEGIEAAPTEEVPRLQPPPIQNLIANSNQPQGVPQSADPSFGDPQLQSLANNGPPIFPQQTFQSPQIQQTPQVPSVQQALQAPPVNFNTIQNPSFNQPPAFQENNFQPNFPQSNFQPNFPQNNFQPNFQQNNFQPIESFPQPPAFQKQTEQEGVFQESTGFAQSPEAHVPATSPSVTFIKWPNTETKSSDTAAAPQTAELAQSSPPIRPQSTSGFNFPSLSDMQLPSLPDMNFLNPFNLLRNREAINPFPRFPSLFSKSDHSSSSSKKEIKSPTTWPNVQAFHLPSQEMQPPPANQSPNDAFLNTLQKIPSERENTFQFMPHLRPIFNGAQKPATPAEYNSVIQPAHATQYSVSTPLIRTHSGIHSISTSSPNISPLTNNQPTNKPFNSKYNQSASKFTQATPLHTVPSIIGPDSKVNVINPQTNPAREAVSSTVPKTENLGPALIKFTLDDVIKPKKRQSRPVIIPDQTTSQTENRLKDILFEDDMTLSPSEDMVTVAHIVRPPKPNTPATLMMERITFKPTVFPAEPKFTEITNQPHKFSKFHQTPETTTMISTPNLSTDSSTSLGSSTLQKKQLTTTTSTTTVLTNEEPSQFNLPQKAPESHTNATGQSKFNSFFPISWGFLQPADKSTKTNTQQDVSSESSKNGLSQAASSRVTIIEATPMPKPGEIYPTLKQFSRFTTPMPETTTPETNSSKRKTVPTLFSTELFTPEETTTITTTTTTKRIPFTRPDPLSLITARKRPEVLMPGRWNQRTINKPPQLEPENFSREHPMWEDSEHIITHNQSKVRYNPPPRKFFHINRPTPRPALIQKAPPPSTTSSIPFFNLRPKQAFIIPSPTSLDTTQEPPTTTPMPEDLEMTTAMFRRRPFINFNKRKPDITNVEDPEDNENNTTIESTDTTTEEPAMTITDYETTTPQYMDTTTEYTTETPITTTTAVPDKPRYNSILRLRNFMTRKRLNRTTSTTPEPKTVEPNSDSTNSDTTNSDNTTSMPSTPPTSVASFNNFRARLSKRPISPLFRRPTPNTKSIITTSTTTTTTTSTTTTKKPSRSEKTHTTFPPKISNFKDIDREHSGSHSSNYERRQPIHEVLLQDHPEMLHLYNWESSRLAPAQDRSDDYSSQTGLGDIEILQPGASNLQPVRVEAPKNPASQETSNLAASVGRPFLSTQYASVSSNAAKETMRAANQDSSNAWETLMGSLGVDETPHSHILFALHKNDPSILDI